MEVREVIRQLRKGQSTRAVAAALGINRKTVIRYRAWAVEQGLLEGELLSLSELQRLLDKTLPETPPPQNISSVEPYREIVMKMRKQGVEIAAIHQRMKERGFEGSYSAVYRFVRKLEPIEPEVFTRVETLPGEEAQVDFGYVGKTIDPETGKERKTWVFVMTLSWSRHQYVEFVFDQKVETWLRLHCNAFTFFSGVPTRIVIDNLKSGIKDSCWHNPQAQQSYRECAEHYGFLIAPCRPYTPEHKGKVEKGGIHYVKRNFMGGRKRTTITQTNRDGLHWVMTTAGNRIHGTTKEKPLERFEVERKLLMPLPKTPYDMAVWKQLKLHRDCYVVFEKAYYSAPFRLVGQQLLVRGGTKKVHIYTDDYQLVASHPRAKKPGQRLTHPSHLPPYKVPGLTLTRDGCREKASQIGSATREVVDRLLDHRPEDRLRTAGRLLRLGEKYGSNRLEAACVRALRFDDPEYLTIKRILQQDLDVEELPSVQPAPPAQVFVRSAVELIGNLVGGVSWK
jgi:transposase